MNYYWMSIKSDRVSSVAYAPKGTPSWHQILDEMKHWEIVPFHLTLHDTYVDTSLQVGEICDDFFDYQPNSLAWPLFSDRIKNVVSSHLSGNEGIEWKEIIVDGKSFSKTYFVPMFTKQLDVVNEQQSLMMPYSGIIVKPCFKRKVVDNLSVFHGPGIDWQVSTQFYVSDAIKNDLLDLGIKELLFTMARVK